MYAVVDIGGSTVRVAFVDNATWKSSQGRAPELVAEISFTPSKNYKSALDQLMDAIASHGEDLDGIGIGILGRLNDPKTKVLEADYGKQWVKQPLVKDLLHRFRCPVEMDNDNVNAARAEAVFGAHDRNFLWIGSGSGHGVAHARGHRTHVHHQYPVVFDFENLDGHPLVDALQEDCDSRNVEKRLKRPMAELSGVQWLHYFDRLSHHVERLWEEHDCPIVFGGGVVMKQKSRFQRFFTKMEHEGVPEDTLTISSQGLNAGLRGAAVLIDQHIELGKTLMTGPTAL